VEFDREKIKNSIDWGAVGVNLNGNHYQQAYSIFKEGVKQLDDHDKQLAALLYTNLYTEAKQALWEKIKEALGNGKYDESKEFLFCYVSDLKHEAATQVMKDFAHLYAEHYQPETHSEESMWEQIKTLLEGGDYEEAGKLFQSYKSNLKGEALGKALVDFASVYMEAKTKMYERQLAEIETEIKERGQEQDKKRSIWQRLISK
jgi:tetratricopeptide (TPR) repeat protein